MPDIRWANVAVDEDVARLVDDAADNAGVPRNVLRAFVIGEAAVMGRVNPAARRNDEREDSVGLLQLNRRGGQGVAPSGRPYPLDELQDPARNLAIGVPPIKAAWERTTHLGRTRSRVERVAALSGHPGNPEYLQEGSPGRAIAERGIARIADIWERLEEAEPDVPEGAGAPMGGMSNAGVVAIADDAMADARDLGAQLRAYAGQFDLPGAVGDRVNRHSMIALALVGVGLFAIARHPRRRRAAAS